MKNLILILIFSSLFLAGCSNQISVDKTILNTNSVEENQITRQENDRYIKESSGVFLKQDVYYQLFFNDQNVNLYLGEKIDADISSFEFLSGGFAKDKNKVYFKGFGLDNIDVNSFEIINDKYAKDNKYVILIHRDDLFVVSDDSSNFKINNSKKTKRVSSDCLSRKITIPENRTIEKSDYDKFCEFNLNTDLYIYYLTGGKTEKYPVHFSFSVYKEGDSFENGYIIDDFYNLTTDDKKKINKGELMYFIYEGRERYYAIKVGNISYRFGIIPSNHISLHNAIDFGILDFSWDLFEKDIEKSLLSLKNR